MIPQKKIGNMEPNIPNQSPMESYKIFNFIVSQNTHKLFLVLECRILDPLVYIEKSKTKKKMENENKCVYV